MRNALAFLKCLRLLSSLQTSGLIAASVAADVLFFFILVHQHQILNIAQIFSVREARFHKNKLVVVLLFNK